VTPYTSYLVEEPNAQTGQATSQTPAQPYDVSDLAADTVESKVKAAAAAPASGAAAVANSETRTALATANHVEENQAVQYVAGKTFKRQGMVTTKDKRQVALWVDTLYTEKMQIEQVILGSDRYFALAQQPQMAHWLAISPELVIVVAKDKAIRITTVQP